MKTVLKLGWVALLLGSLAGSGFAGSISIATCVTNNSASGWVLTGANGGACGGTARASGDPLLPATFVVPEGLESVLDPVGDFTFNKAFALSQNGYMTLMDVTGGISDYILIGNTFGGLGEIFFYSDSTPTLTGYTNLGIWCNETANGCVASFAFPFSDGSSLFTTAGSDGESGTFDPFNSGMNTSDGIQFSATAPEPATWMLIGSGLLVAILAGRRSA